MSDRRIASYPNLDVWRDGMELVVHSYAITDHSPPHERFTLTTQARRAAVPVPANITEGLGRHRAGGCAQRLHYARASLMELETHLTIGHRLSYVEAAMLNEVPDQTDLLGRRLTALIESLKRHRR